MSSLKVQSFKKKSKQSAPQIISMDAKNHLIFKHVADGEYCSTTQNGA